MSKLNKLAIQITLKAVARDIMSNLASFNHLDEQTVVLIDNAVKEHGLDAFKICKESGIIYFKAKTVKSNPPTAITILGQSPILGVIKLRIGVSQKNIVLLSTNKMAVGWILNMTTPNDTKSFALQED